MHRNSPEFKKLQKEWYKVAKKSGFKDIEQDELYLLSNSDDKFREHTELYRETKTQYYRLAGQFFHEHPFENEFDRKVWELHSEGLSIRRIVKKLKEAKIIPAYKRLVHDTIKRLARQMVTK